MDKIHKEDKIKKAKNERVGTTERNIFHDF
jgi:hypothetical protein